MNPEDRLIQVENARINVDQISFVKEVKFVFPQYTVIGQPKANQQLTVRMLDGTVFNFYQTPLEEFDKLRKAKFDG